jgi:D-alanine-D-alanine ligase
VLTKRALEREGVLCPPWTSYERAEWEAGAADDLDLVPPVVVKPAANGSSLGVSIVRDSHRLEDAFALAFQYGDTALVERYIQGRELTVPILGDDPLPVLELRLGREFYDYDAKYEDDQTQILCPAELPPEITARAQATALATHLALGCRDVSRADMILDPQGLCWVLETNTLPGLTSHSLLPRAALAVGLSFTGLCEFLLCRALERSRQERRAVNR